MIQGETTGAPLAPGIPLYVLDCSHGLGTNQIHGIAMDRRGQLWLAKPVGLACYDGSFIHHRDRRDGLSCNGLRCVAVDEDDQVWVGSDQGLERILASGRVAPALGSGTWTFGMCQCIDVDGHTLWIGSANGLVKLERAGANQDYEVMFSADVGFVSDIQRLPSGSVLAVSTALGLVESDGKRWWRYRSPALAGLKVTCIQLGQRGEYLVGTEQGLLVLDGATGALSAHLHPGQLNPSVMAIALEAERYWVAFGRTVVAYRPHDSGLVCTESFQFESSINDLLPDPLGNVWVATNSSGLAKISCLRHALRHVDIDRSGGVYAIQPQGDDCYLIAGERLLGRAHLPPESTTTQLHAPDGLPESVVWDALETPSAMWAATQAGLFRAVAGGDFQRVFAADPVLGAPCRVIIQRDDALWIGSLRGLACVRGDEAHAVDTDGGPLGYVYTMALDAQSVLWIGTLGKGLWREQDGLRPVLAAPLTADGNVYAVAHGPAGRTLVLQDENVILLEKDLSARLVAQLPPVAGWTALWLDAETVAIGGSDGLRVLEIERGHVLSHVKSLFRLRDWEFTNNRTLVAERDGRLLCGLTSGLARVDLGPLRDYPPPQCRLVDVSWTGLPSPPPGNPAVVEPGRWSFHLRACATWWVDPMGLRYQFQLVGLDADWSPWRDRLEAHYNSLPPGNYRLRVRAHSPLTGVGPEADLLHLQVRAPYWARASRWVFWPLLALNRLLSRSDARNRRMLLRHQQLEQEVLTRTNALHASNEELKKVRDTFKELSEIDELTQLGNRRKFDSEMSRAIALVHRLQTPMALLMVDIDYFKAVNDRLGHPVGDTYLQQVAQALANTVRVGEDVVTRFGGEEFAVILTSTDANAALACAERLRVAVIELGLPNPGAPGGVVTISVGVALSDPGQTTDGQSLLSRADRALYRAKDQGRNRVVMEAENATA